MTEEAVLITGVTIARVPITDGRVNMLAVDNRWSTDFRHHSVPVHDFRGGIYGDGVRLGFGPGVEPLVLRPIRVLEAELAIRETRCQSLSYSLGVMTTRAEELGQRLDAYTYAGFWARLRYALTGRLPEGKP